MNFAEIDKYIQTACAINKHAVSVETVKNEAVLVTNITYFLPLNNLLLLSEEFPGS